MNGARVIFNTCRIINSATDRQFNDEWVPILLSLPKTDLVQTMGGVDFIDCFIEDNYDRPSIAFRQLESDLPLHQITGEIDVHNPNGVRAELGIDSEKLPLVVKAYE